MLYQIFIEPYEHSFMQTALLMGTIVAVLCAVLSCFIVLKGWSLLGDAVSHAVLPGIVLAYAAGLPIAAGAFAAGLLCAGLTGFISENSRIQPQASIGIVYSGLFAAGLILYAYTHPTQHLTHILFGNLLGIPHSELVQALMVSGVVIVLLLLKWKDLMLFCFDEKHAVVVGLSVTGLRYLLLSLLALTIVSSMQVAGVVLVVAMLIAPGSIALLVVRRFKMMLLTAVAVSVASTWLGITLSFYLATDSGPTIVVLQSLMFFLTLIVRHSAGNFLHRNGSLKSRA